MAAPTVAEALALARAALLQIERLARLGADTEVELRPETMRALLEDIAIHSARVAQSAEVK